MTAQVGSLRPTNPVALVTGGSGGIGRSIVRRLVAEGYRVHFTYRSDAPSARELSEFTGTEPILLDFAEAWDVPDLPIDVVVHSAGVNLSGHEMGETTASEIDLTFRINVAPALRLAQTYVPRMRSQSWGRIVSINSVWGFESAPKRLSYSMSKHALRAFTVTVGLELAGTGVTVNEVCPGPVDTRMLRAMGEAAVSELRHDTVAGYLDSCCESMPTMRLVDPDSVAHAVAYLCSDLAGDVVSQSMRVTGACEY